MRGAFHAHVRAAMPVGGKSTPSLRVAPQIASRGIARRSFRLLSSRLACRVMGQQRCTSRSVNRPKRLSQNWQMPSGQGVLWSDLTGHLAKVVKLPTEVRDDDREDTTQVHA